MLGHKQNVSTNSRKYYVQRNLKSSRQCGITSSKNETSTTLQRKQFLMSYFAGKMAITTQCYQVCKVSYCVSLQKCFKDERMR